VVFNANPPVVDLGPNLDICPGDPVTVDAGAGFNTYSWSTGATSQSISVNAVGTYVVVVTNESGCEAFDFISVTATGVPVAIATVSTISGLTVNIANQSAGANQALWDFNGDGVTDLSSTSANISYTYTNAGTYTAQLIVVGACGNDTLTFPIQVVLSNGQEIENKTVNVYPNPANDFVQIISDNAIALIEIMDINGRVVIRNQPSNGNNTHHLGVDQLANGVYQIRISGANGQWISSQKFIKQ
jgi:PKD repeat protein